MIALPPSLAPWQDQLTIFDPSIAAALGGLIQRLDAAIGPLRTHQQAPGLDVDGYDGITRRGDYERMLLSEWLLADELPEEFLRRAASAEQLFLAIARREPAGSPRSVIIFDAGPEQVGSPRIAHLALLIVMARRASKAGAAFEWYTAQNLHWNSSKLAETNTLTEDGIRTLLKGASIMDPDPLRLMGAEQHFTEELKTEDLWFVGGRRPEGWKGSFISIEEPVEPGAHELRVVVHPRRGAARSATLELPEPRQCVRIFRDPFRKVVPAAPPSQKNQRRREIAFDSEILFGANGRHVFVRLADGAAACFPLNMNAVESNVGPKLVVAPSGGKLLGVGRQGRMKLSVSLLNETLYFTGWRNAQGKAPVVKLGGMEAWTLSRGQWLGECFVVRTEEENRFILRRSDWVFSFVARGNGETHFGLWNVPLVAGFLDGTRYVGVTDRESRGERACLVEPSGKQPESSFFDLNATFGKPAFFGCPRRGDEHPGLQLMAVQESSTLWRVVRRLTSTFQIEPALRVCGVVSAPEKAGAAGLLAVQEGSKLIVIGTSGQYVLAHEPAGIAHAAASPYSKIAAYLTTTGTFVVLSLESGSVILRREMARPQ